MNGFNGNILIQINRLVQHLPAPLREASREPFKGSEGVSREESEPLRPAPSFRSMPAETAGLGHPNQL
jgi:hypothetical protein